MNVWLSLQSGPTIFSVSLQLDGLYLILRAEYGGSMPRFHLQVSDLSKAPPKGPGNMPAFHARAPVSEKKQALEGGYYQYENEQPNG